ncbi:MAG: A/G-specific adenine glycosylase [Pirellulales bacterium]
MTARDWSSFSKRFPHLSPAWRRSFHKSLSRWFDANKRSLPWRETRDPYAIWISESMLQQTQVATVIGYFHRFLDRFPTVIDLAAAEEEEVLALWAGLGYYRRARGLHAAAKIVAEQYAGVFPKDVDSIRTLPGIGRYTAGAVASIAYDHPAPILEANTERVFARLLQLSGDTKGKPAQSSLWDFASWILEDLKQIGPGRLNQAAMELGSLICKPRDPQCSTCPLVKQCPTHAAGLTDQIPQRTVKSSPTPLHHAALLISRGDSWLMRLNRAGSWWTGLWDLPRCDITEHGWLDDEKMLKRSAPKNTSRKSEQADSNWDDARLQLLSTEVERHLSLPCKITSREQVHKHGVTRYRITVECFRAEVSRKTADKLERDSWQWCDRSKLAALPLTAPAKAILKKQGIFIEG